MSCFLWIYANEEGEAMQYKIVITSPDKETIEKVYEMVRKSAIYNSKEIISLHPIKEVCDECVKRD